MPLMKQTVDMFAEAGIKLLNPGLLQAPSEDARKRQADEMAAMNEDYIQGALRHGVERHRRPIMRAP